MTLTKRCLVLVLSLALLAAVPSVASAKFFKEAGLTAFYNQDSDVGGGDLNEAGAFFHVAAPLWQSGGARLDLRIEFLVGYFHNLDTAIEVALVPALRLYFGAGSIMPYLEGGIGPSINGLDIDELGIAFNFLSFGGVGLRFPIGSSRFIDLGYRLRHISNAGLDERNGGVTSHQIQVGLSWEF